MSDLLFYATIEVHEYGEEPREQRIGPFSPEEGLEDDAHSAEEQLRRNLEERGDHVLFIERAERIPFGMDAK